MYRGYINPLFSWYNCISDEIMFIEIDGIRYDIIVEKKSDSPDEDKCVHELCI